MNPNSRAALSSVEWRKSSYSSGTGGECLEVADNLPGAVVPVRDSKNGLTLPRINLKAALDRVR